MNVWQVRLASRERKKKKSEERERESLHTYPVTPTLQEKVLWWCYTIGMRL